jgi:hypothetical protein
VHSHCRGLIHLEHRRGPAPVGFSPSQPLQLHQANKNGAHFWGSWWQLREVTHTRLLAHRLAQKMGPTDVRQEDGRGQRAGETSLQGLSPWHSAPEQKNLVALRTHPYQHLEGSPPHPGSFWEEMGLGRVLGGSPLEPWGLSTSDLLWR